MKACCAERRKGGREGNRERKGKAEKDLGRLARGRKRMGGAGGGREGRRNGRGKEEGPRGKGQAATTLMQSATISPEKIRPQTLPMSRKLRNRKSPREYEHPRIPSPLLAPS
jgi:hypothetical protein